MDDYYSPAFEDLLLPGTTCSIIQHTTPVARTYLDHPNNYEEDELLQTVDIEDDEEFDAVDLYQDATGHLYDERSDEDDEEEPPDNKPETHTEVANLPLPSRRSLRSRRPTTSVKQSSLLSPARPIVLLRRGGWWTAPSSSIDCGARADIGLGISSSSTSSPKPPLAARLPPKQKSNVHAAPS